MWEHDSDIWQIRSGSLAGSQLRQFPFNRGNLQKPLPPVFRHKRVLDNASLYESINSITVVKQKWVCANIPAFLSEKTARRIMPSPGLAAWATAQASSDLEMTVSALTATITFAAVTPPCGLVVFGFGGNMEWRIGLWVPPLRNGKILGPIGELIKFHHFILNWLFCLRLYLDSKEFKR